MVKVSVIVPIYNVAQYLRRCIDSILDQTFTDFEVILVDDGATDQCPEICDEYAKKDDRVVVIHKSNGGLSDARNAGLDVAKGEYIYFCDSDDYIYPVLLSTVIPYMENGYDMTVFQFHKIDEKGIIFYSSKMDTCDISLKNNSRSDFLINYFLQIKLTWAAWNRVYRRSIIEDHKLRFADNKKIFAEDLYFCLCYCAYCDKLCLIDKTLYCYLQRKDSIMGKDEFIGNVDRFSLLAQAVFNTWVQDKSLIELIQIFPIIYYLILYHELGAVKNQRGLSDQRTKDYLFSHLPNMDFFMENLSGMGEQIGLLTHSKHDKEFHRRKSEIRYWQNNNYLSYRLNCLVYNTSCDIITFFRRVSISFKYRFGRVLKK